MDVGKRLALLALNKTYGQNVVASGPVYKTYRNNKKKRDTIIIKFDYAESGLKINKGEKLKGFAIAGEDLNFVWANAVIDPKKNEVIVSHPDGKDAVAVRYAWADNPVECNLVNSEGLPAAPFRTDDLPLQR